MNPNMRILARMALDKRLKGFDKDNLRTGGSWVRMIREAIGMTTRQLARRLDVSQPRIVALEKAERNRSVTLETLERAASALDCDLVYALVPRKPLETTIKDQAMRAAMTRLIATDHTMALENQRVMGQARSDQIHRLADEMVRTGDTSIWDIA